MYEREKLTIRLQPTEKWWAASIDERPGVLTQGKTVPSTLRNLADAYRAMEEVMEEDQDV